MNHYGISAQRRAKERTDALIIVSIAALLLVVFFTLLFAHDREIQRSIDKQATCKVNK